MKNKKKEYEKNLGFWHTVIAERRGQQICCSNDDESQSRSCLCQTDIISRNQFKDNFLILILLLLFYRTAKPFRPS